MLFRLSAIPNVQLFVNAPLARYTRFEIGGPARMLANVSTVDALAETLQLARDSGTPHAMIGGGTNLIVDDRGFPGVVTRYVANAIEIDGTRVRVEAGAVLQDLVDETIAAGLRGLETMTGIPGWVGGAIYGNAGAYGHSIHERVESVSFLDGEQIREITRREISNDECKFRYRESIFKSQKNWLILAATLKMEEGDAVELARAAAEIRKIRDAKYPPTMHCAGSIFKNLLFDELPARVRAGLLPGIVREGKVPSAYFLERAGAKGMANGAIRVADYHANLIYNTGGGTAAQVRSLIDELKARVQTRFGITLEEEVQYV